MREDWVEVELGEIVELNPRNLRKNEIEKEFEVQFLPMKLVEEVSNIIHLDEFRKFFEVQKKSYTYFAEGDVLFAKVTPCMENGKIAIANNLKNGIGYGSSEFHVLRCSEIVSNNYLFYYIVQEKFRREAQHNMTGAVGLKRVPKIFIEKHAFPLPPLPIQRAIVSKIEALFFDLDNGIADLKKAQEQLKIYRQAVLKKAFEGELTKEWREKQTDLPTAEELLEQIKKERQKHYEQQLEDWSQAVESWAESGKEGKKPKKPVKPTKPDSPNEVHILRQWNIPKIWTWTQIGTVCFVTKLAGFEYTDYVNYVEDGDLKVIKAENATQNGFKKTNFSKVKSESVKMLTRSQVFGGELLVVFVGAGTGNVSRVPLGDKYFLGPNIGMARPYFELDTRFFELQLQSGIGKHLMMATVKAVAQPSLSMGTIRQTPIAFPSIKEQQQIIREIESYLSICDKVEQNITEALEKSEALRQSILKKAFEGKLLSEAEIEQCKQEADYKPASVLLEKIKAEKQC